MFGKVLNMSLYQKIACSNFEMKTLDSRVECFTKFYVGL